MIVSMAVFSDPLPLLLSLSEVVVPTVDRSTRHYRIPMNKMKLAVVLLGNLLKSI